jgi:hypothetical protein
MGFFSEGMSVKEIREATWQLLHEELEWEAGEDFGLDEDDNITIMRNDDGDKYIGRLQFYESDDGDVVVNVLSPVVKIPVENPVGFYRRLLEWNLELPPQLRVGVNDDTVVLECEILSEHLVVQELNYIITTVLAQATSSRPTFIREFGARSIEE